MKEYKILESESKKAMEELVNNWLAQGWEVSGSLQASDVGAGTAHRTHYRQALIRDKA
jgi:hypothetical protein